MRDRAAVSVSVEPIVSTILNGSTIQSSDTIREFSIDGTYLLRLPDTTVLTDLQLVWEAKETRG